MKKIGPYKGKRNDKSRSLTPFAETQANGFGMTPGRQRGPTQAKAKSKGRGPIKDIGPYKSKRKGKSRSLTPFAEKRANGFGMTPGRRRGPTQAKAKSKGRGPIKDIGPYRSKIQDEAPRTMRAYTGEGEIEEARAADQKHRAIQKQRHGAGRSKTSAPAKAKPKAKRGGRRGPIKKIGPYKGKTKKGKGPFRLRAKRPWVKR